MTWMMSPSLQPRRAKQSSMSTYTPAALSLRVHTWSRASSVGVSQRSSMIVGGGSTVPPVRGKRGRPRCRPDVVLGDRGYDHDRYRRLVWDLGVKPLIARRGTEHASGLGAQRRVVEHAFAHLHWFRRLRIHWEIRDDIHEAFLALGCALIGPVLPKLPRSDK